MTTSFVAAGAQASGTGAITAALPAGIQTDDLLLLVVETANEAVTVNTAGWTALTSSPQGTGTAAGTAATQLSVYYRWVDGAETNTSIGDSGNHTIAAIGAYRGVSKTSPFNAQSGSVVATATTTVAYPSITTTADNCQVLLINARALPDSNTNTQTTGHSNATLTGIVTNFEYNTTAGNGGGFCVASGLKATAGSTGTSTATNGASTVYGVITLALTPLTSTGSLDVTETGSDTFSATGSTAITGTLAASETGSDTFAATGSVLVQGSLSATETGADTFAATGSVLVQGALAATESGSDAFSASGTVLVEGALAATEIGNDTAYINGGDPLYVDRDYADYDYVEDEAIPGSMAVTETGADTFAATGTVTTNLTTGELAATETGSDSFAASGDVPVSGAFAVTESGDDTFAAPGTVLVSGAFAASETGADTLSANGTVLVQGTLAVNETGDDTFAATGSVPVQGSLAATEYGVDGINGHYVILGYVSAGYAQTEQIGSVLVQGALAVSETGEDAFMASGAVFTQLATGALAATETGGDTFSATGGLVSQGGMAAVESGSDTWWSVQYPFVPADSFLITGDARSFTLPGDARTFATTGNQRVFTVQ